MSTKKKPFSRIPKKKLSTKRRSIRLSRKRQSRVSKPASLKRGKRFSILTRRELNKAAAQFSRILDRALAKKKRISREKRIVYQRSPSVRIIREKKFRKTPPGLRATKGFDRTKKGFSSSLQREVLISQRAVDLKKNMRFSSVKSMVKSKSLKENILAHTKDFLKNRFKEGKRNRINWRFELKEPGKKSRWVSVSRRSVTKRAKISEALDMALEGIVETVEKYLSARGAIGVTFGGFMIESVK
jgi:hypothetical protein